MEVLQFEKNEQIYLKLAQEKMDREDYFGALGFLFSALEINESPKVLRLIAESYGELDLYEQSNRFWFFYLDKVPNGESAFAYEEIAVNYFYMEDYVSATYYLHKKLSTDGVLNVDDIPSELFNLPDIIAPEKNIRLVHPKEKEDYSKEEEKGKIALSYGKAQQAVEILEKIPLEFRSQDVFGDLSMAYIMLEDNSTAESIARESIVKHGENSTAFCCLSAIYQVKEDNEKSQYYYNKALDCYDEKAGDKKQEYRLALSAIDHNDHKNIKLFLGKILSTRKSDVDMRFLYALSILNMGDYELAEKEFSYVYRLSPFDSVCKFYAEYASKLAQGENDKNEYLPISYLKALPKKLVKKYNKTIKELVANPDRISLALKKKEIKDVIEWGIRYGEDDIMRECVYVLATAFTPYAINLLLSLTKDNTVVSLVKRIAVYALVANGYKERFSIVDRNFIISVKPKKLVFEKDNSAGLYVAAYALCISRMAFLGVLKLDKIATAMNNLYKHFNGVLDNEEVEGEELCAMALWLCKFERFSSDDAIKSIFEISDSKFKALKKIYEGEKND